jgi:hypothetical protein
MDEDERDLLQERYGSRRSNQKKKTDQTAKSGAKNGNLRHGKEVENIHAKLMETDSDSESEDSSARRSDSDEKGGKKAREQASGDSDSGKNPKRDKSGKKQDVKASGKQKKELAALSKKTGQKLKEAQEATKNKEKEDPAQGFKHPKFEGYSEEEFDQFASGGHASDNEVGTFDQGGQGDDDWLKRNLGELKPVQEGLGMRMDSQDEENEQEWSGDEDEDHDEDGDGSSVDVTQRRTDAKNKRAVEKNRRQGGQKSGGNLDMDVGEEGGNGSASERWVYVCFCMCV